MSSTAWQLNMFGPPEDVSALPEFARYLDDAPVACERELLWPAPHIEILGKDLLERLYGDLPRRTRLNVREVCRRLRCGHTHVHELIAAGSLDALDYRHPQATQNAWSIYRYSVCRLLFSREFVDNNTRCGMPREDLDKCLVLAEKLRNEKRRKG